MRRLIDPIELKKSIVVSNIIGDGKTLEELIDEQPDAQPEWKTGEIAKDTSVPSTDCISRQAAIDLLKQMRKDGDMIPWEGKDVFARIRKLPSAQPELIEKVAYIRGFEQGRTQGMIDSQGRKK